MRLITVEGMTDAALRTLESSRLEGPALVQYHCSDAEVSEVASLLEEADSAVIDQNSCQLAGISLAARLPSRLAELTLLTRSSPLIDGLVLKGLPRGAISDCSTPTKHGDDRLLLGFEMLALAIAMLMGQPMSYATQQGGRLINDIVPLREDSAVSNASSGYLHTFDFHTEDAFMCIPPNFIQLACVRNPTNTPVTLSGLSPTDLEPDAMAALRSPSYRIGVNPKQSGWGLSLPKDPRPVVEGPATRPRIRYNAANTVAVDEGARGALAALRCALSENSLELPLADGDIAIIDNHRIVHSRSPYEPSFAGKDRWLLRIVSYRDVEALESRLDPSNPNTLRP
ncbi:Enduracididine beta-hydroxylase [Streptomyces sp. enrichment culture]|uniref:TauD/TfdA family dioxygenase n=1 Tax=Streptomyces sp. enrichment culture TaxID=1795815 RepID=UPI003F545B80